MFASGKKKMMMTTTRHHSISESCRRAMNDGNEPAPKVLVSLRDAVLVVVVVDLASFFGWMEPLPRRPKWTVDGDGLLTVLVLMSSSMV